MCGENSQVAGLQQLQSLLPLETQAQKMQTKETPDRNPGEGRAAGQMGISLYVIVAHRDTQESVHQQFLNQPFLK